jgi:hypothetical protein
MELKEFSVHLESIGKIVTDRFLKILFHEEIRPCLKNPGTGKIKITKYFKKTKLKKQTK